MQLYLLAIPAYYFLCNLIWLCYTDPNPIPLTKPDKTLGNGQLSLVVSFVQCNILKWAPILLTVYTTILSILRATHSSHFETFCPLQDESFLDLTSKKLLGGITILILGYLRLECYRKLGECFQYHVRAPPKLIEDGVYRYVCHPSYTCVLGVQFGVGMLFLGKGNVVRCFSGDGLELLGRIVFGWVIFYLGLRVLHEEEVLKESFGEKWEAYRRERTRFVPFLF